MKIQVGPQSEQKNEALMKKKLWMSFKMVLLSQQNTDLLARPRYTILDKNGMADTMSKKELKYSISSK